MTLSKALDRAIAQENRAFLADADAQEQARALGDLYRRVYEAQEAGYVQAPGETLADFVARAAS